MQSTRMFIIATFATALLGLTFVSASSDDLPEIKPYVRTKVCELVHENAMPYGRFDMKFEKAPEDFDPETNEYVEGVVSTGVPALVIGILSLIFFMFRCIYKTCICMCRCCGCRKCCCKDKKDPTVGNDPEKKRCCLCQRKPKLYTCLFAFCAFLVVAGVVFGFFQNKNVTEGVEEIRDAMRDFDANTDLVVDDLTVTKNSIVAFGDDAADVLTAYTNLCNQFTGISCDSTLADAVDDIEAQVANAKTDMESGINNVGNQKISDELDKTKDFDEYRELAQLIVLILLLLPYFFVFLTLFCNKLQSSCFLSFIVVYSAIIGFLGWLVTSVETIASVLIADLCYEPGDYLVTEAREQDASLGDFIEFYVKCTGDNPLQDELNTGINSIETSLTDLGTMTTQLDGLQADIAGISNATYAEEVMAPVQASMTALNTSSDNLLDSMKDLTETVFTCNRINNVYTDSLRGLCDTALTGLVSLALVQGLESFAIFIAIYTMLKFVAYAKAGKGPEFMRNSFSGFVYKDENDEYAKDKNMDERL